MDIAVTVPQTFLTGGGEMGVRIAAQNWSLSGLGPIDQWPVSLRTAISMVLNSKFPSFLCWGPDFISFHNDAYTPLLGTKQALGRSFREVWSEAWDTVGPIAEKAYAGEASYFEDLPIVVERFGYPEQTYFSFSYSPVRDETGAVGGILCTVFETTDKVNAIAKLLEKEEALRHLNARLQHEAASHAADRDRIWKISHDVMTAASLATGKFTTVNPAFTETFGWSQEEATSVPFMDLVYPDDKEDVTENMRVLAAGAPLVRYETRVMHKDGSHRWVSWTIVPEGELLYGVARDITAEKKQTDALQYAEEALRQSQKMEAVGQLTDGLQQRIEAALGVTERAAALTHRLLAFSRRQALDPKLINANELVASMADLIYRTAGPTIKVETRLEGSLWMTLCDPNQLESALLNLAINARDAMPNGGTLTIETENITVGEAHAAIYGDLKPGEYVTVTVSDTGTGMTADVATRAFDPFFTTKPLGQGTGLGLSMVYGFAKQSGGHASIHSQPGRGTIARMRLPRQISLSNTIDTAATPCASSATLQGNKTAMIVDDEPQIRSVLVDLLQLQGYAVLEAGDAREALKILEATSTLDVLVTDIGLPNGLNGRQLADLVRTHWPELPVLLITGYAEEAVMKNEALPEGMHLLTKPFSMNSFTAKLAALIS
ncbi:ATP-binding protein [Herbaspirillum sp. GCM10030257]|uniref:hybrid sensor histidine kinase/response regulator n=1 Tax=Herbaspirillum sp. GCM10030257 TaxID=3273393 RepID=UPI00360C614F